MIWPIAYVLGALLTAYVMGRLTPKVPKPSPEIDAFNWSTAEAEAFAAHDDHEGLTIMLTALWPMLVPVACFIWVANRCYRAGKP
jgi:hypothetical protein